MIVAKTEQLTLKTSTWEDWVAARDLRARQKAASQPFENYSLPQQNEEAELSWWQNVLTKERSLSFSIYSPSDHLIGFIKTFNHNEAVRGIETSLEFFDQKEHEQFTTLAFELFLQHIGSTTNYKQLLTLLHPKNKLTIGLFEQMGFKNEGEDSDLIDPQKVYTKLSLSLPEA